MTESPSTGLDAALRLQMRGICKSFGATRALDGVSLEVYPGEIHALIGENGAGKSTLMKILSGAATADAGQIWIDEHEFRPRDPSDGRAAGVAMIYQELSLAPHLSVMENILLGVEPARWGMLCWKSMRQLTHDALAQVGRPDILPETQVHRLSLADRQLVEVARSVALGCRILVLDEPTSSVSARDVQMLFRLMRRLKQQGLAIVYISHFLEEIQEISDRFTVIRDGRTVGTGVTGEFLNERIVQMMVGRQVEQLYPRSPRAPGEVVLATDQLSGIRMPTDVSLSLRCGEVLGIAGLIGSGRTELVRAIFGLDPVGSGAVRIGYWQGGTSLSKQADIRPQVLWRRGVGMVSEDRTSEGLALGLSLADNITLPQLRGLGPWRWILPGRQQRACLQWIEDLAIKCRDAGQRVADLSGGNQQKVALARLLHADVDVWLLDEPTRGIDVGSKAQIYRLIDQLVAAEREDGEPAKAVLMISSYLPELLGVCDRIAVMNRGRLHAARATRDRDEHEIMWEATKAGSER
jgi:ribose transport system ATP-binding protein